MPVQVLSGPPDLQTDDPVVRLQVYQHQAQERDFLKRIQEDLDSGTSIQEIKKKLIAYMLFWPKNSRKFFWIPEYFEKLEKSEKLKKYHSRL